MTTPSLQLNGFQRNSLQAGVKYIDRLLAEALAALSPLGADAIFAPTLPDATPVQRKVIADHVARLRRVLRSALDVCNIPVSPPEIGALWNLRCTLVSVDIALEDFGPDHLRGYGAIDDATGARTAELRAQIRTVLTELLAYLESGLGGDLSARLARLDQTRDEVRLLRELERNVTVHGLVELRGHLERLLDRVERNWWTVAFVGRVSSGKSSLLNHLLATDVLPAGVTPITAVPIRIVPGTAAAATVFFAAEKSHRIPVGELGEFASEERNPGNARQVTDILLELAAPRLAGEMCFVDTPGLGSLATAGAAQTLAFLPRCDLGVILIDATATPTADDIAVARTLLENGAEVLLVLSKADLLAPADCEKVLVYVRRQFVDTLGRELPVAPVSVTPGHTAVTERWFAAELAPRQVRHRELAAAALRRKIGALRDATVAALAVRAGFAPAAPSPSAVGYAGALGAARAAFESNRNALHDLAYAATPTADTVFAAIAGALAAKPADDQFPEAVARELGRAAARLGAEFDARLRATRDTAARALVSATGESREGAALPQPFARPLFDPAPILATSRLSAAWRRWPAASLRRRALQRHLSSQLAGALDDALRAYARSLIRWSERFLDELAAQFNAQAGIAEVRTAVPRAQGGEIETMRRDLELLRNWNARSAA